MDTTYDYEPIGPIYDEAEEYEEWEPTDFQRWYYGKKQYDEIDKYFEVEFDAEEELRYSIED